MPRKKATAKSKPSEVIVVRESYDAFDYGADDSRGRDPYIGSDTIGSRRPYWQSTIDDRTEGRWLPIYETEWELAEIRAKGRKLASLVSVATGAQDALANYVLGQGFTFTAEPTDENGDEGLAEDVQEFVDKFLDDNDFVSGDLPGMDRDVHSRSREDGEYLIALYAMDPDTIRIRGIDPSQLTEPLNQRDLEGFIGADGMVNYWRFGVHTANNPIMNCEDVERPLGYHVVYDGLGNNWDYITVDRMVHAKRNVGRTAKRGVSDYYAIWRSIERVDKLTTNIAEGAAVQAAIAFIREHVEGATQGGIQSVVSANSITNYDQQTRNGVRNVKVEKFRPGTVKDIPHGMRYLKGPMGESGHLIYVEVAQLLFRVCGIRWNMPEYLISGDASNANLASSLVAESPFVKAREADQQFYKGVFLSLVWKALKLAFDAGRFAFTGDWDEFKSAIDIKVEVPDVASRDGLKQAQENDILSKAGILSPKTWASKAQLDYESEVKNGAEKVMPMGAQSSDQTGVDALFGANPEASPPAAVDGKEKAVAESGGAHTAARPFVIRKV